MIQLSRKQKIYGCIGVIPGVVAIRLSDLAADRFMARGNGLAEIVRLSAFLVLTALIIFGMVAIHARHEKRRV